MEQKNYSEYPVSNRLSPYIDCIWFGDQKQNSGYRIIPDNTIELIFTTSSIVRTQEGMDEVVELKSHLAGLKTKAQTIQVEKGMIAAVRFKPEGVFPFIKQNLSELVNASVAPELIFGQRIKLLEDVLLESMESGSEEAQIVRSIEDYFLDDMKNVSNDPLLATVVNQIQSTNGTASIASIAEHIGCSIKTVERKFKEKIGLPPKKYSRLYRFHQSILNMESPTDKLSNIAYDNGYFDQMHFIKEVKKYTGLTPKRIFDFKSGLQQPTLTRK